MGKYSKNIKRFFKTILFFGFVGLFLFILTSAAIQRKKVVCSAVKVNIANQEEMQFLNEEDVLNLITGNGQRIIINQPIAELSLSEMETELDKNPFISKANIHSNFDGMLMADIEQKEPLFRVFNNKGVSYYISESGTKMPLSPKFTPRLIVATGYIPEVADIEADVTNQELKMLIDFILADEFWNALIGEVHVNQQKEYVLYPKIDGLQVVFGGLEDKEEKFKKLKIFLKEALLKTDWKQYKTINLKYKGQIVCSKT